MRAVTRATWSTAVACAFASPLRCRAGPPPPLPAPARPHLAAAWEQRPKGVDLGQDGAHRKHVDGRIVGRAAQQHLGGAVPAAAAARRQVRLAAGAAGSSTRDRACGGGAAGAAAAAAGHRQAPERGRRGEGGRGQGVPLTRGGGGPADSPARGHVVCEWRAAADLSGQPKVCNLDGVPHDEQVLCSPAQGRGAFAAVHRGAMAWDEEASEHNRQHERVAARLFARGACQQAHLASDRDGRSRPCGCMRAPAAAGVGGWVSGGVGCEWWGWGREGRRAAGGVWGAAAATRGACLQDLVRPAAHARL